MRGGRTLLGLVVALLTAALVWWGQGDDAARDPGATMPTPPATASPTATAATAPSATVESPTVDPTTGTDPESGLPWVPESALPPEAHRTLALIDQGGPYPYEEDGTVFSNREQLLPDQPDGYYHEFTVETPGLDHRGARRIVSGSEDELYYTEDHYSSFARISWEAP